MKGSKNKKILSIILIVGLVLQNTNIYYATENIASKGNAKEENIIVDDDDDIVEIYKENKSIIIGKLRDDEKIGAIKNSINDEFKYVEGEVLVYRSNTNKDKDKDRDKDKDKDKDRAMLFGSANKSHNEFDDLLNNGKILYDFEKKKTFKLFGGISNKNDNNNDDNNNKSIVHIKSDKYSTKELIENLSKKPEVCIVEPNYIVNIIEPKKEDIANFRNEISGFSDTEYSEENLTHLQFDKSNVNDEFHKYSVKVPNWNVMPKEISKNSEGVVVAVIDTGVDYEHPDLKNVMWDEGLNYPTLTALGGGKYGICTVEGSVSQEIMDDHIHGTHCSGIIAAEWNNIGVSGVCNGAKIMGIKVGDATGKFSTDKAIAGFNYVITAKKAGVNVACISCSWGGSAYSFILKEVIVEIEKNGIASVFAAGNENLDIDLNTYTCKALKYIPAGIVVDSSTVKGGMSSFSNYGKSYTDVAAPGSDILSTIPREFSGFSTKLIPDKYIKLYKNDGSSTDLFNKNDIATNSSVASIDDGENGSITVFAIQEEGEKTRLKFNKLNISSDDFNRENVKLSFNIMGMNFVNPLEKIKASLYIPCVNVIDPSDKKDISLANVGSKLLSISSYKSVYLPIYKDYIYEIDGKEYKIDVSLGNDFYCILELESAETEPSLGVYLYMLNDMGVVNSALVPYDYMSGTSMACPQVAGMVAVIAAKYPNETPAKWIARIKGSIYSGATSQSLIEEDSKLITYNNVVSGGLVSLEKALQNDVTTFNPVINNIIIEDNKYILKGFFFGNSGKIKIKNVDYTTNVKSWLDEKIVIDIPNSVDISGANVYVEIKNQYDKTGHQYIDIEKSKYIYKTKEIKTNSDSEDSVMGIGMFEDAIIIGDKTYYFLIMSANLGLKMYGFISYDNKTGFFNAENGFDLTNYNILDIKSFIYAKNNLYAVTVAKVDDTLKNVCVVLNLSSENGNKIDVDDSILGDKVLYNSAQYFDEKNNRIYLFGGELISRDGINKNASKKIYILDLNENKILSFDGELSVERLEPSISKPVKNIHGTTYFYVASRESSIIDRVEFSKDGQMKIKKDVANIPDYNEILSDTTSYVKYIPIEHGFYVAGITKEKNGCKYNNYKLDIEHKKLTYDGYIRDGECKKICGWTYGDTGNILSYTENGVTSLMYSYFPYRKIVAPDEIRKKNISINSGGGGGSDGGPRYDLDGNILGPSGKEIYIYDGTNPPNLVGTINVSNWNYSISQAQIVNIHYAQNIDSFVYDDNSPVVTEWVGVLVQNTSKLVWYRTNENGQILRNQFIQIGTNIYYLDNNGIMVTGQHTINGKVYNFETAVGANEGRFLY